MTARRATALCSLTLALLIGAPAARAAAPGGPMTAGQVASLLAAGVGETVILRQVAATGTRLVLTVDEILMLKRAGATDRLLAALVGPADAPEDPAFRIYREKNDKGEEVLVVTNLDESGRRLGGEIEHDAAAAAGRREDVAPDRPEPAAPVEPVEYGDAGAERQPPVIVNIYPPEDSAPPGAYEPGFAPLGYWPVGYQVGYPAGCYLGARRHPRGHGSEGSGGFAPRVDQGFFGRPSAINTRPYRHGDAAQRNREAFRRH